MGRGVHGPPGIGGLAGVCGGDPAIGIDVRVQTAERDPGQAEQIIAQGRRAINNNDIGALKAANRQLLSLLPHDVQEEARHVNVGGTITRG